MGLFECHQLLYVEFVFIFFFRAKMEGKIYLPKIFLINSALEKIYWKPTQSVFLWFLKIVNWNIKPNTLAVPNATEMDKNRI